MIDPITQLILEKDTIRKPYSHEKVIDVPTIRNGNVNIYHMKRGVLIVFPSYVNMWKGKIVTTPVTYSLSVSGYYSDTPFGYYSAEDWQYNSKLDLKKNVDFMRKEYGFINEESLRGDVLVKGIQDQDSMSIRMFQIVFDKLNSKIMKDKTMFHLSMMAHDYSNYLVPKKSFYIKFK